MTYDSLVLGGAIELLNGGVVSTNPLCPGAMFRLQPGADPGAPQPTTDYVASLILDGERPFGRRSSNRTIKLPIWITGPTRGIVAAAREVLQTVIDQDYWTMAWTRDPSTNVSGLALPLILDCFRAQPTANIFNTLLEKQGYGQQVLVTIPALPYGRSDVMLQVPFASPAPAPSAPAPPPSPVVLDTFSSISSTQCFQSTQCVIGPFSVGFDPDLFGDFGGQVTPFTYTSVLTSAVNLTGMTSLQFYMGMGSRYYTSLEYRGKTAVSCYFTLTDSSGNTLRFSRSNFRVPVSPVYGAPCFTRVSIPIPQNNTGAFNFASVASYSFTIVNRQYPVPRLAYNVCYIDTLTAYPGSQTATPVTRGAVYTLYGVQGTARAPLALQFQQPPTAGSPTTITAVGAGTYTVPAGTAYLKVECIGGGGPGASLTGSGEGGGGGSAEYAREQVFACIPGQVIPYVVGTGGAPGATPTNGQATVFGPVPGGTQIVTANGGGAAAQNSTTGGLGGTGSNNSVHYPGAAGRNATGSVGGGGASSAGNSGPGQTPTGTAPTYFTSAGSNTWLCPAGVTQVYVEVWGGGGSGASGSSSYIHGGAGGGGEYAAGYLNVTPGNLYNYTVGPGGAAVSGNQIAGNNGAITSFTGDNGTISAHGGSGGTPSYQGGSGAGGSGSAAPTHYSGGSGGVASPYSGGGGASGSASGAGGNGNGYANAGTAGPGGGNGGLGSQSSGGNGSAGAAPGGGGGGCYGTNSAGAGATGQLKLTVPGGTPNNLGAPAVAGGGAGGNGGASPNTTGSAGAQPGGGGGGADSTGSAEGGGNGGTGEIIVTPYASAAFKTLIAHRPPLGTPKTWQPLISVGGGNDAPNGSIQYPMAPPNLTTLESWDFEDGTVDGWGAAASTGSAAVSNYTGWANTGTHSLLLTAGSGVTGYWQAFSPSFGCSAGQFLTLSAVVKNPNATTTLGQVNIGFNWYGASGYISSSAGLTNVSLAAGVARAFTMSAQAPVGATSFVVTITDGETVASGTLMAMDTIVVSPSQSAAFSGTYTVYLINSSWNGSGSRTVTVTVTQQDYAGGPTTTVSTIPVTFTPSQITNGILTAGVLTLPIKQLPPDNTQAIFSVSVTDSNTSDRYYDMIFLDTQGQTVVINQPSGYITYYIDTPNPNVDLGFHGGAGALGRPAAVSVFGQNTIITGPLYVEPADGDNLMFAYSADALAPNIDASYYSSWWFDRYA